jgi:two-component system sensor histidine kinase/response regulator
MTQPSSFLHDLRTPLNQIIGYSEMLVELARDSCQPDFEPDLQRVLAASARMLSIIDGSETAGQPYEPSNAHDRPETRSPFEGNDFSISEKDSPLGDLILVVDDDEGNRDVLSRRLQKEGYTVADAGDGSLALQKLAAESFDMVLLDIMMPELDGYEVLRRMKADDLLRHIPVIMISALGEIESVARCIEIGADDYLTKPFNPILLKARVSSSLDKKRGRDREVAMYEQLQENYAKLEKLETLRDDLTHMIIHDLRTPLTSVMAAIQTLDVVGEVNSAQREVVTIAVEGADSLLGTINSLLDVEKLESGAMMLDLTLLALPELIASAVNQIAALAVEKKIELIQNLAPELPWLLGDEDKLRRTLVNLLGNAIKFTPSGGIVTIDVTEIGQSVQFCVRDTGEGIPVEQFDRIFEKFGQVDSRTNGRLMSSGLGLTFCKLTVEAHGGHIGVESTPWRGSTFTCSLPVRGPSDNGVPTGKTDKGTERRPLNERESQDAD